jgi:hypothetical protein
MDFTVKGLYGHQIDQLEMILATGSPLRDEDRVLLVQALARMEQLESAYRDVKNDRDELRKKEGKWLDNKVDNMVSLVQDMRNVIAEGE